MKTENPPSLSERFNDIDKKMIDDHLKVILFRGYNNFVTQELNPLMFVPAKLVNGKLEVLKHPDEIKDMINESMEGALQYKNYKKEYQKALSNVLFEGWKYHKELNGIFIDDYYIFFNEDILLDIDGDFLQKVKTIEDILHLVTLTPKGKEMAGLI